jgi:hypothetical protein
MGGSLRVACPRSSKEAGQLAWSPTIRPTLQQIRVQLLYLASDGAKMFIILVRRLYQDAWRRVVFSLISCEQTIGCNLIGIKGLFVTSQARHAEVL